MENTTETKKAMLRAVLDKKVFSWKVFAWTQLLTPLFVVVLCNIHPGMSISSVAAFLAVTAVFVNLFTYITIREARDICIETTLDLENVDMKDWFKVTGVVNSEKVVEVTVKDCFGNRTKLCYDKRNDQQSSEDDWLILSFIRKDWEPVWHSLRDAQPLPDTTPVAHRAAV